MQLSVVAPRIWNVYTHKMQAANTTIMVDYAPSPSWYAPSTSGDDIPFCVDRTVWCSSRFNPGGGGRGGGGWHSGTEGDRTRVTYFAEEGGLFKTSACPRFCKRRVLFCAPGTMYGGSKSPLQSTKYTRLWLPSDSRSDWAFRVRCRHLPLKHAEDYNILS